MNSHKGNNGMRNIDKQSILKRLKSYNQHWFDGNISLDVRSKPRRRYFDLFFKLASQFSVQRAIVLMGPRRVGKTILLLQSIQQFIDNDISAQNICYIPLDEPLFSLYSLEECVDFFQEAITSDVHQGQKIIIFDEIQYLKNWDIQLKRLVDNYGSSIKFIVSGSAAGALRRKSQESGAGRFTDFMLPPLTFYEYLDLLGLTDSYIIFNQKKTKAIGVKNIEELNKEFINYINYGGFPEAIFDENIRANPERFIRQDIIDKVLLRDLPSLYGIANIQELNRFFSYLCYQTGGEVNYDTLSKSSGVAANTIKKYLEYLEAAFLIRTVNRVNENGKTFKRANFIKVYLTNPSMYAALYGLVSADETTTLGNLVETALFSQWGHDTYWLNNIYYARFKKGKKDEDREVDMVYLDQKFKVRWCLEAKWSDKYPSNIDQLKGLLIFCKQNEPEDIIVSTKTINKVVKLNDALTINFKESALICFNIGYSSIMQEEKL